MKPNNSAILLKGWSESCNFKTLHWRRRLLCWRCQKSTSDLRSIFSWDCTWLPGPARETYYYLVMILDIFSRKVVGWEALLGEYSGALDTAGVALIA